MRYRILLFLLLLLPAWVARAQAPNWQTVLGNSATVIRGSAANASGDYYVIGTFNTSATFGSTTLTTPGDEDMFLAKFSGSTNTFVWAVSGGGTGTEDGRAVAVNGSNVYVTGSFVGAANISGTPLAAATGSGLDMYVAKYVDNGTTVTPGGALSGGGGGSDAGFSIAVNGTNVYVSGYMSANATTPVISGTTLTSSGSQDMFVARFTDGGSLANGSAVSGGGGGLDRALAIGVNGNGVYVTGFLSSNAIAPVIQGAAASNAGGQDMFLAKYTATLGNAGVVSGGGSTNDQGQTLTISGNNIYIAGTFTGTASIAGSSLTSAGLADMFVAKYTDPGSGLTNGFAARDGGGDTEAMGDMAVTGTTLYVVGSYINSTTLSGSALTSLGTDAFVAKYTDLGSSLSNQGAIDGGSNAAGTTSALTVSLNGPQVLVAGAVATPATFGSIAVASGTAYVAKLAPASTTLTSIVLGGSNPTNAASVTYTVTFGSTITGLSTSNFSLTSTGTIAGTSVTSVTGSGTTYTVTVNTGTGDGTLRLNLANDTGISLSISNSPYTSGPAYTIDKTAPTVAITSSTAANGGTSGSATFAYTVTFSENVNASFVAGDVTVTNGTISGFTTVVPSTTFTFNVTPTANGVVSVTVPANVAQDAAGNFNTAGTPAPYSITYSQPVTAAPVLTAPANGSLLATTTPIYSGTAVAGSTVTVYVDGSSIGTTTATAGGTFSLSQPSALAQGSHTVRATAQASGSAVSSNSNTNTFTVDTVQPTVAISSSTATNGGTSSSATFAYTVIFSEAVTGFTAGDVTVGNGTLSGFAGSGTTYTFNVTPTANGLVTVNVPANVAQDAATNFNTAAAPYSITYSQPVTTAPVVSLPANVTLINTSTPTYSGTAPANSTVTVFVDGASIGTTTANASGNWSLLQPTALSNATHTVNATAQSSGSAVSGVSNTNGFTVDTVAPSVTITSSTAANGGSTSTSPIAYTVTFSEAVTGFVAGDVTVGNGTISGFAGGGTTYTFNVTPTANGAVTVNVPANVAQDAATNFNTAAAPYSITYTAPTATVASVTRSTPSPTATASVSYQVTFSASVTGVSASNFSLTTTGAVAGASVTSVTGSGTTYTVTVNTGTGDGTLRLDVANNTGLSPTVSNTPYTGGQVYTITRSFAAAPQLTIVGTGGTGSDVTAFVDVAQVLSGGSPFANALQNGSFETHNPLANGDYGYNPTGASWTFNTRSGIAESGSAFTPTTPIPNGIAVAFVQSQGGVNGQLQQNLALPTGASYQVNFQTAQRVCCTTLDQALNVFLNGVFIGTIQPGSSSYSPFTSATFAVTAPALTATISSTAGASGSSTSASPIPFTVTFSQSVGTSFTASDVTVGNGTVSGFAGSGSGPYTFNVTPTANGAVTVSVAANQAQDANNTGNTASSTYTLTYTAPITATSWTGAVSTDWFLAGNWSSGVPTATVDATIPAGQPRYPAIPSGAPVAQSLTIDAGGSLAQAGGTLDVRGNWTNNGTLTATGGTVQLGGTSGRQLLGSSSSRFWNLTITGNQVTVGTNAGIRIQRMLTTNAVLDAGTNLVVLESDATGTAMLVNAPTIGTIGTNFQVQRYISPDLNAGPGYRHLASAAVSLSNAQGTMFSDLTTASFTPVVNTAYNGSATPGTTTPFPNIYGYDQSRLATVSNNLAAFDKGWVSPNATSDRMTSGFGYTVNVAAGQTVTFKGGLGYGTLVRSVARNVAGTANDTEAGWNLMGNPYPSPYDYSLVAPADRSGLDAAIYIFESTGQYVGNYRSYINGVGGNPILALGQAFFTRMSAGQTSGSVTFRDAYRVTSYQNPVYHRSAETRPLVQLDLHSATGTDPLYVYFQTGATAGFDSELDAAKLPNSTGLNLSAEAAGQRLTIDGLPVLGTATVTVPLTVGVPAAGSFSFTAAQLLNLSTTPVYLRDRQTGAVVDLARQPSYSFVVSNASALITGRFELVFSPQAPLATAPAALAAQVGLYPNPAKSATFVELPAALGRVAVAASLVDALGRTVRTQTLPAQGAAAHKLSLAELATGIYTLHLATTAGVVVKKLVIE